MHSLPLFHRIAGERVVVIGDGDMAAAKRRLVERAGGVSCGGELVGEARLAFVALDDPVEAEAAAARLKEVGLLVNVADRPELCDFTLPSMLERGDVLVAVSTGGASAGLAKHLRLRLERLLPPSLAKLAAALKDARGAMRARWPDADARRRAVDDALAEGGPLDPLDEGSAERIEAWLDKGDASSAPETIEIALISADPDDLTLRQARLLGTADVIVHDADTPSGVLARARADAVRVKAGSDTPVSKGLTVRLRSPSR